MGASSSLLGMKVHRCKRAMPFVLGGTKSKPPQVYLKALEKIRPQTVLPTPQVLNSESLSSGCLVAAKIRRRPVQVLEEAQERWSGLRVPWL